MPPSEEQAIIVPILSIQWGRNPLILTYRAATLLTRGGVSADAPQRGHRPRGRQPSEDHHPRHPCGDSETSAKQEGRPDRQDEGTNAVCGAPRWRDLIHPRLCGGGTNDPHPFVGMQAAALGQPENVPTGAEPKLTPRTHSGAALLPVRHQ
jgi:hypothetical protein